MPLLYQILLGIGVCCAFALLMMHYAKPLMALPHKEYCMFALLCVVFIVYMVYLMMPITVSGDAYRSDGGGASKTWEWKKRRCA